MDLLQSAFSDDPHVASSALERLCEVAQNDIVMLAALGGHPRLLPLLRDLLAGVPADFEPSSRQKRSERASGKDKTSQDAKERLRMAAAFLISQLAGRTAAIDARLLEQRFVPALAGAAAAPAGDCRAGWGRRRGTLRAISKLLAAQPACSAAQLVACGGVVRVAGLLDAPDADQMLCCAGVVARRCLSILTTVAGVTPYGCGAAGLLDPPVMCTLIRLLAGRYGGCGSAGEVERDAAALLVLICREPGAAPKLAAAGAGPVLSSLASKKDSQAASLAQEALQVLQQQAAWQALQQQQLGPSRSPSLPTVGAAPRQNQLSRAASAPFPLPAVPGRQAMTEAAAERTAGSQASGATSGSISKVQQWQEQLQQQGLPLPEQSSAAASRSGGWDIGSSRAPSRAQSGVSAADLVAVLYSGYPRSQLAAAEQLAALAASGARAAAVIATAGGADALAWCVSQNAAGPVTVHDTLHDAYEAAVREGLCMTVLRALCTLCQQVPAAAAALPPAAPSLQLLLAGPDPQQRQLAAMLLATLQAEASNAGEPGATDAPQQAAVPAMRVGTAAMRARAAQPAAMAASPDLLPSPSQSALSELPPDKAVEATPSTVLQQQANTPGSSVQLSNASDTPRHSQQIASGGSSSLGAAAVGGGSALQALPQKARRQLAQLLRKKPPHPAVAGGWQEDRAAMQLQPAGSVSMSRAASAPDKVHLWAITGSAESVLNVADQLPSSGGNAAAGSASHDGSALSAGRASASCNAYPSQGPLLRRSEIVICQAGCCATLDAVGEDCKLGEGGFGVVLKGLMNGVDEVAVKRIKAAVPTEAELATFHREVALLANLRHRNIVQYYGACLEPGSLFIVTELMKGGDLYTALRRHPAALRWERLGQRVALDVALGLNYLHSRQPPMSHRDLKSPNILLSEEGVAKLADVGMMQSHVAELVTAQPLLTPLWSAPEVLRREKAGVKADMWSYGILIWELVSGTDIADCQPLAITRMEEGQRQQGSASLQKQPAADAPALLQMPAGAPPVAVHIFQACTQLDPALRPNAQQVVEWLRG